MLPQLPPPGGLVPATVFFSVIVLAMISTFGVTVIAVGFVKDLGVLPVVAFARDGGEEHPGGEDVSKSHRARVYALPAG